MYPSYVSILGSAVLGQLLSTLGLGSTATAASCVGSTNGQQQLAYTNGTTYFEHGTAYLATTAVVCALRKRGVKAARTASCIQVECSLADSVPLWAALLGVAAAARIHTAGCKDPCCSGCRRKLRAKGAFLGGLGMLPWDISRTSCMGNHPGHYHVDCGCTILVLDVGKGCRSWNGLGSCHGFS